MLKLNVSALKTLACAALSAVVLSTDNAQASYFDFDLTFDGTKVTLDEGSADPVGTVFEAGDSFDLTVEAAGHDYWSVDSDYMSFLPLTLYVNEEATRVGDISTTFYLDGAVVASDTAGSVSQEMLHMGAQFWDLEAGLAFDSVTVNYTLSSVSSGGSSTVEMMNFGQPISFLPFYEAPEISYVSMETIAQIPLPAGLPLMLSGLAGVVLLRQRGRKRRKRAGQTTA